MAGDASDLTIYYVSDTHGHVFPVDYATGRTAPGGILAFASQVSGAHDADTLVIDGGDSLQGSPLIARYLADPAACLANPVAAAMNAARVDYFTLGNHDFNFGYEPLAAYLRAMEGTCLCANVEDLRGGLRLRRSAVHVLGNGLRVGITGVVTDWVNVWESSHGGPEGVRVLDPFDAAARECADLAPLCDVCVCVYHGGFEEDLATGQVLEASGENVGCRIARELDFDLLLTAHQHREVPGVAIGGTWCLQPGCNARKYARVEARPAGAGCAGGPGCPGSPRWSFSSELVPVGAAHADQPYRTLMPFEEAVQRHLDERIGELASEVPPVPLLDAALHGSPLADLVNAAQLWAARRAVPGVELSCTASTMAPMGMPARVTERDVVRVYPFQNSLMVVELDEAALRATLERCAAYLSLGDDGSPKISDEFVSPKLQHFNHDFYAGLDVTFDLRRAVGERVVSVRRAGGAELGHGPFLMAMNDYRATGTGGYDALRGCPVRWTSDRDVPGIVADYVRACSPVEVRPLGAVHVLW